MQVTANYVRDTQMKKTLIALAFEKIYIHGLSKKCFYNLHKHCSLPPIFIPVKGFLALSGFWVEPEVPSLAPNIHFEI